MQEHWAILFVDDDEDDYILTQSFLALMRDSRVNLQWAPNYEKGLEMMGHNDWDAILIDFDLGARDGVEFIREAVRRKYTAPLIMITGRGSYEKEVEAMEAGASDYLTKSDMSTPLLERSIRYAIDRHRNTKELEQHVEERTAVLQIALEELQVFTEELDQQNVNLIENQAQPDNYLMRYKFFFEFSPEGYLITDQTGLILEANRMASSILNVRRKLLTGKPLVTYIAAGDRQAFFRIINTYLHDTNASSLPGALKTFQLTIQPRDQEPELHYLTVLPFFIDQEQQIQFCWLIHANLKEVSM